MSRILPPPRSGLLGHWDRFVGPGMTAGETSLVIAAAVIGTLAAALHLALSGSTVLQILIGGLIAFDVIGGAVCNCTDTTKRWYHRSGQTFADQFGFVALHVLHIALIAVIFRGDGVDFVYAGLASAWLLVSAYATMASPSLLKNPVAVSCYLIALAMMFYVLGPTSGMEWFLPALFVKLLIGHAVPPERTDA